MNGRRWTHEEDVFLREMMDKHSKGRSLKSLTSMIQDGENIITDRSFEAIYQHLLWMKRNDRLWEVMNKIRQKS